MMMYYVRGDKRKHVSPDVFVSRGVPDVVRKYYLVWEEPRGPEFVIELSSKSTRKVDLTKKFALYRDVLGVEEYFLYDPLYEYLDPPLRGFRRRGDEFVPIEPVDGRLPSEVIGLHLEDGGANDLRLHDPATGLWLPTWEEVEAGWVDVKARLGEQDAELRRAEEEVRRLHRIEEENAELRRELEALRRGRPGPS